MKQDKAIDEFVYVVTRSEEHNDYVEAVFYNRGNAEKYCKQFNDNEDEYSRNITEVRCLDTHPTNYWHKVEDELPPRIKETVNFSKTVIVSNGLSYGIGYYNYNLNKWFCVGTTNITHWMELPELPKEE